MMNWLKAFKFQKPTARVRRVHWNKWGRSVIDRSDKSPLTKREK